MPDFDEYLRSINLNALLSELDPFYAKTVIEQIKYFTEKEAENRDRIVLSYFGEEGVKRIVDTVVEYLLSPPKLDEATKILDVGAGTGFFTVKVAGEIRKYVPGALFYAMDITPAMLRVLIRKTSEITCFLGLAEDIVRALKYAKRFIDVPEKFDAVFSILTLHHCLNIENVFRSIKNVLNRHGRAVVVDLCEHPFEEFREEMGDIHLGFKPEFIKKAAEKFFSRVSIKKMPGICCECSGRSAELFVAYFIASD